MKLVIQIPCFNEADTLAEVLADLPRALPGFDSDQILVIDDGSTDGTSEIARANGADKVVKHSHNRGLAATFMTGLDTALKMGADIIVNTDGDHQYPGDRIACLVEPILAGRADLTLGDRQPGKDKRVGARKRFFYNVGNRVVRTATGVKVHDAPTGFRAMTRAFAVRVYLTNPFSYTLETLFQAAEEGARIEEIHITANDTRRQSRLFRSMSEYIKRSASIVIRSYTMHRPLRAFAWLSLPFLLLGLGLGFRFLYFFFTQEGPTGHIQSLILAAISIIVGAQVFLFGLLGDLLRTNRLLLEDIRERQRKTELTATDDALLETSSEEAT